MSDDAISSKEFREFVGDNKSEMTEMRRLIAQLSLLTTQLAKERVVVQPVLSDGSPYMVSERLSGELSPDEEKELDKWQKKVSRGLSDCDVVEFEGTDWAGWKKQVICDLVPLKLMKYLLEEYDDERKKK
jgi:hypothetical protein